MSTLTVGVVGNPNCGKTTLFNAMTGARQTVGNWPGVTVEKKVGHYSFDGQAVELVDLPGTYSLDVLESGVSLDEQIARDYILNQDVDLIVNILDGSNLERNLYLTLQLLEMKRPVLVAVNMLDVAREKGLEIDLAALEQQLGCPVIGLIASRREGIEALKAKILQAAAERRIAPQPVRYPELIEQALDELAQDLVADGEDGRWRALKLIEGDSALLAELSASDARRLSDLQQRLQVELGEELDIILADCRYSLIASSAQQVVKRVREVPETLTDKIDRVVLNRLAGIPIFLGIMYLMFMFTIHVGSAFIDFFDILVGTVLVDGLGHLMSAIGSPDWLTTIIANGLGGGIQTVATFIPVIACLFLFMSALEDSGYMARAAFVMDRLMRALGLPGKSFVAMLVGFGCNVPSMMAARTLENPRDRYLTIAMAPFMSCGARLPVYALFAVAFFPSNGQNVVFALYLIGILAAVATGLILRRTLLPGQLTPFVMELPAYHVPTVRGVLIRTWDRLKGFIIRAGKAIALVVMVLNVLNSLGTDGSFGNDNTENSVLTSIGKGITPIFAPMGVQEDNWPATVGIFTGIFAKEAVVGTLDALYTSMGDEAEAGEEEAFDFWGGIGEAFATIPENLSGIADALGDPLGLNVGEVADMAAAAEEQDVTLDTYSLMQKLFGSSAAAFAYLVFVLLYTPCVAALGAVYRETNLRWTLFVSGWTFALAYCSAVLVYQGAHLSAQPATAGGWLAAVAAGFAGLIFWMRRQGQLQVDEKAVADVCSSGCSCS